MTPVYPIPPRHPGRGGVPGPSPSRLYPCMAFRKILRCNSAAARQFRARKRLKSTSQRMKWPPSKTMVSYFRETVSYGPEKQGIGGENGL